MDCDKMLKLIHGKIDGVLDEAESRRLDEHLAGCSECVRLLEQHRRLRAGFRDAVVAPPPELRDRILKALIAESRETREAGRVILLFRRAAVAALVFLAVSAALFFGSNGDLVANAGKRHYEDLFAVRKPAESLEILLRTSDPQSIPAEFLQEDDNGEE